MPATRGAQGRKPHLQECPWLVRHSHGLGLAGLSCLPDSCALLVDRGCVDYRSKHRYCQDLFPDSLSMNVHLLDEVRFDGMRLCSRGDALHTNDVDPQALGCHLAS